MPADKNDGTCHQDFMTIVGIESLHDSCYYETGIYCPTTIWNKK
jgi:hypothetical protein